MSYFLPEILDKWVSNMIKAAKEQDIYFYFKGFFSCQTKAVDCIFKDTEQTRH